MCDYVPPLPGTPLCNWFDKLNLRPGVRWECILASCLCDEGGFELLGSGGRGSHTRPLAVGVSLGGQHRPRRAGLQLLRRRRNGMSRPSPARARSGMCFCRVFFRLQRRASCGAIPWPSFPYVVFPGSWMCLFPLLMSTHFVPGGNGDFTLCFFFLFVSPTSGAAQRVKKEEPVCFNN